MSRIASLCIWIMLVGGCERAIERLDFERMRDQSRLDIYGASPTFPDGSTMRVPPAGTVSRERVLGNPGLTTGMTADGDVTEVPMSIDRVLLERGRDRFERICGACHGILGTGNPAIVENATLRPPPSLHELRIRRQAPGRIFHTISAGFGLMPEYATHLSVRDRWAIVVYLRVLWSSQDVELAALSPAMRDAAEAAIAEESP